MGGLVAASSIDWTTVIVAAITVIPALVAAIYAGRIHAQIRTPSGKSLGDVAEYAHDTVIANNMLLSKANGPTKPAAPGTLRTEGRSPPRVPDPPPPDTPSEPSVPVAPEAV